MTEISNEVIALEYNPTLGEFRELQVISALPEGFTDKSQGSAIRISKDGRFLYAANRGHDSIAIYKINQYSGELSLIEWVPTEGNCVISRLTLPRHSLSRQTKKREIWFCLNATPKRAD